MQAIEALAFRCSLTHTAPAMSPADLKQAKCLSAFEQLQIATTQELRAFLQEFPDELESHDINPQSIKLAGPGQLAGILRTVAGEITWRDVLPHVFERLFMFGEQGKLLPAQIIAILYEMVNAGRVEDGALTQEICWLEYGIELVASGVWLGQENIINQRLNRLLVLTSS
jgi:hypothetical protein